MQSNPHSGFLEPGAKLLTTVKVINYRYRKSFAWTRACNQIVMSGQGDPEQPENIDE
jgi:hypothetical protein